jgi:hypothetical protein
MNEIIIHDHDMLVYDAEEAAVLEYTNSHGDWSDDAPAMKQEDIPGFFRRVMDATGWAGCHLPEVRFDIPDDHHARGIHHFGPDGEYLRFHPRLLTQWNVLHELAHWLRPRDGHGPQFCGVLTGLIRSGIDENAARILQEQYAAHGVHVDMGWAQLTIAICKPFAIARSSTMHP